MSKVHEFLYRGSESKLFNDARELEQALADGWSDAPGKDTEEKQPVPNNETVKGPKKKNKD